MERRARAGVMLGGPMAGAGNWSAAAEGATKSLPSSSTDQATHLRLIKSYNTQTMDARVDSRAASVEENDSTDINAPLKAAPKLVAPEPGNSDSPFAAHSS